jgi:hypothetical protein
LARLLGYDHKELAGSQFWAGSLEGCLNLPFGNIGLWVFYNAGKVSDRLENLDNSELKQSIGLGLAVSDGLRFDLARRLDRSSDAFQAHFRFTLKP